LVAELDQTTGVVVGQLAHVREDFADPLRWGTARRRDREVTNG
jgi:hypothetical protein